MAANNRYAQIIEHIFHAKFVEGVLEVEFEREEFAHVAQELGIRVPKNLGDIIYSFRYRTDLPPSIADCAPEGMEWVIKSRGSARYAFVATAFSRIRPNGLLAQIKVPDATPGIIGKYALSDEQALLALIRYNRLIDIFTGVTCYPLQSHLRTTVPGMGQVETDELYIGVDKQGAHHVFPVQAKGGSDSIGIVQIEQDFALCRAKFPTLLRTAIAAQFMENNLVALFSFEEKDGDIRLLRESHYHLVPHSEISPEDLAGYGRSLF